MKRILHSFAEKAARRPSLRDALRSLFLRDAKTPNRHCLCRALWAKAMLLPAVFAVVFLSAPAARADIKTLHENNQVTWGTEHPPQVIYLLGGEVCDEGVDYDEIILKFTDTTATGSLTIAPGVKVSVRSLVVGGGGAGGTSTSTTAGAGGGGGAGGFIDQMQTLESGTEAVTYTITVGAGGAAATTLDTTRGQNGAPSSFVGGSVSHIAFGGGGGGAMSKGNEHDEDVDIGSGGGGSYAAAACSGGLGTTGQGNAGGRGAAKLYGAGGGGAGKSGSNTGTGPGAGGTGFASDIILDENGIAIFYAGGGGGGRLKGTAGMAGGNGGGGKGGSIENGAENGIDGFGGGGGGSGTTAPGGKGGDGVVILRIRDLLITPPNYVDLEWNNENQIGYAPKGYYEIVEYPGDATNATSVGTYKYHIKPADGFMWADGQWSDSNTETKTIEWKISALQVDIPTSVSIPYDGNSHEVASSDEIYEIVDGTAIAKNAGEYSFTLRLLDTANTVWSDGSTTNITTTWFILAKSVEVPTARNDLVYDGGAKNAFETLDWSRYELVEGTTTNETEGGSYEAKFHLKGNDEATNYVWNTTPATSADQAVPWSIARAENKITSLEITGWRIGFQPNAPTIEADFGKDTVKYAYGFGATADDVETWIDDPLAIDKDGPWIVKATIDATSSWDSAEKTKKFEVWSDPRKAFRNHVDITINLGNTTTLTNFPVLIKISETRIRGFLYSEAGTDGHDVVFMPVNATADTDPLPCEVDTWNKNGESYIWVCVPEIPAGGTTITMYWYLGDGMSIQPVESTAVWTNGYIGVWHMTEANGTVADATGHGLTGTPSKPTTMIATPGKIGNARINATKVANGTTCPALQIPNYNAYLNNVSRFAVGGWFFARDMTNYPRVFSRKTNYDNNTGWEMEFKQNSKTEGTIRGSSDKAVTFTTPNMLTAGWVHLMFVFNDTTGTAYVNGTQSGSGTIAKVATRNDGMTIGSDLDLTEWCWGGYYDECRLYNGVPSADWIKAEYATVADDSTLVYSPIVHDGIMDNWWVEEPTMDKTSWDVKDTPGVITNPGILADGTVSNIIYSVYDPTQTFESIADITEAGNYRIYFLPTEPERYVPIDYTINFRIVKSKPYTKIGGTNGNSGRILLMNRDTNTGLPTKDRCPIDRQGYSDTSSSQSTFWQILGDLASDTNLTFNLKQGYDSILWTRNYAEKLWHLENCRHGNTYPKDVASGGLLPEQNYLPYSSTSYSIKARGTPATQDTVGQVVMRNMKDAAVYSPCYTNGIGTIYFDAVNGWKGITENNNIVVEIATSTIAGLPPTDANCMTVQTNSVGDTVVVSTNWYGNLDDTCWTKCTMRPFVITNGSAFVETNSTTELSLQMDIGGRADCFYRVVVPVDYHDAIRFRIRRTTFDELWGADARMLILLDNIIASIPAMGANLESPGFYYGDRTGKQQLGWELATSVPYPSVEDEELFGGAKPTYYVNSGDGSTWNTNEFFHSAAMYYRWRYLGNATNSWQAVNLDVSDGFKTASAFELPGFVCDVEYWYEYTLQAPFYRYVDYSGIGKAINYTEERGTLTSAYASDTPLLSGGTNWFFRIREGASPYEKMVLTVDDTTSGTLRRETIDMDLVGSHQWRGFVPVTNKTERVISFFLKGVNPLADGATEFDESGEADDEFRASADKIDISSAPYAGTMMKVGEEVGYRASVHYLTNVASYIEFQFNDATRAISISHADYQDFNTWFSSRWENDNDLKFYSSAHETNSTSIATKRYPAEATNKVVSTFAETPRTATAWHETFALTEGQSAAGFPKNEPFQSLRTPKGWLADQGMWVAQKWGMTNSTDFALQMEGRGKGSVTFNQSPTPNGLDTIEFSTRLAQFNEFKNVSFSWEQIMRKNYTIAAQACFDTDPQFLNFSGEASISLFTGYVPYTGGYEYRITIYNIDETWKTGKTPYTRACVRHAIYKWYVDGGTLVDKLLVEVLDNEAAAGGWFWTYTTKAEAVKQIPLGLNGTQYSGIYMSFSNANDKVYITAGVSNDQSAKEQFGVNFTYSGKEFQQIGCEDPSPVTKFGTYGVLMKNCPGRVLYPRIYDGKTVAIPGSGTTDITGGKRWKESVALLADTSGSSAERNKIGSYWAKDPGRAVELSGDPWGLVADTNIAQNVGVYTMPVGSSENWTCLTNISVATFNNDRHVLTLQSTKPSYVKFASSGDPGDIRTDIVIDDIMLTQWCGQSGSSTNASSSYGYADDFYYTGAWISNQVTTVSGKPTTNRVALLAPRRAESPESPIGIRSPYMDGIGAIIFDYRDADEGAKVTLQAWVGSVSYLYGHLDDAADKSGWVTLTNWTFSAGSGTRSYYYGLRSPSNGVFRLVIPQSEVREAYAHSERDPNWHAITITDVYCYDEPPFDAHSWWGWNFLTTGWNDSKGNKYAAIDDSKEGAVGVLNNTLSSATLETGNANDYNRNDPFIQSPTFNDRNVGEIAFRARRYGDSSPSYITVWGAKSGDLQKKDGWTAITNVLVDSVSYERYTVKCADEQGFAAVRLGVAKVQGIMPDYAMKPASAAELPDSPVRVLVDEIVIRERVKPEVGFRLDFVRPFRLGLSERTAIENIASRDQQPLQGEQFGFQAEVEVTGLSDEVDLGRIPEVKLSIYPKAEPWGYDNWKEAEGAVLDVILEPAEGTNLVFRSMSTTPLSFTGPFEADPDLGYGIVQYFLTVKYWDKGGDAHTSPITSQQWKMPSWYQGFDDPNEKENAKFSPFTVLDSVSPGRAWFNEVNFSDENGNSSKQFIELCFPAGYDMTGWRIYRYDVWGTLDLLASLGLTTGVPASKEATGGDPNFAFLALTSSKAAHPDADANWSSDAYACGGNDSYGFQLVRPSGIIEHQVVVQGKIGTGRYANNKLGTNVVVQLTNLVGGTWEFVGADTNVAVKSSGVFQNAGTLPSDWNDTMDMTPGMINGNQVIPPDWFLPPSGTNVWLSLSTLGSYVWVVDGEDRVAAKTIVVPQGTTTNLVFETAPWYQLGALMRDVTNDVTAAAVRSAGVARTNVWTYAFKEDARNSATLVASAAPDSEVLIRGQLDPSDPYTPAVMNWLLEGTANGDPFEGDEISTNCFFQGLSANGPRVPLSLKDRYWLDIDPTSDKWDLRGGMGEISNLSAPSPTVPVVAEVRRNRPAIWPDPLTNRVVSVALMISNKVDNALSRAPNRLQGLGGEKSDVVGAKNWTSETFKVMMSLIKPAGADGVPVSDTYWPMASFVFDANSFGAPDGPNPFTARIEVADPMTKASSAYAYGWWKYPGSTYGYKWDLSHGMYMRAPDMLSTTNTWDKTWETPNDW